MADKGELTPKRARFVEEYLIDLNASAAYQRAGYAVKDDNVAKAAGSRLLADVNVSRVIAEGIAEQEKRTEITADYVLTGLVEVAERCMQRKPVMVWDREEKKMVQAVDENGNHVWMFDSTGANRALELLGKHKQMFTDKVKHDGSVAIVFGGEENLKDEGE